MIRDFWKINLAPDSKVNLRRGEKWDFTVA